MTMIWKYGLPQRRTACLCCVIYLHAVVVFSPRFLQTKVLDIFSIRLSIHRRNVLIQNTDNLLYVMI